MALLRYVRLDRGIWNKPFMRLHPDARTLWLYLVDYPVDTLAGIVHFDYDLALYHLPELTRERIDTALDTLVEAKQVSRDGDFILVKDFTGYQGYTGESIRRALEKELDSLVGKTTLVQDWAEVHPVYTPPTPRIPPVGGESLHYITEQNIKDKILPNGSISHDTQNEGIPATKPKRKPREPRPEPGEPAQWLSEQICDLLDSARTERGYVVVNPRSRASFAYAIQSGLEICECDAQKLYDAWRAAWNDPKSGWLPKLLNMAAWSNGKLFATLLNWYKMRYNQ